MSVLFWVSYWFAWLLAGAAILLLSPAERATFAAACLLANGLLFQLMLLRQELRGLRADLRAMLTWLAKREQA
ncbi:MAG: hypothetical protein WC274_09985 [Sulfurimonas sp.]